ncbi:hypothetical protein AMECASPLE_035275 [Ameca splendens]|uniref:Uncharacterized protein n=1 Tax=Ameca splendens TaxID=208324 RepID=A0ABV0XWB6_9TELE
MLNENRKMYEPCSTFPHQSPAAVHKHPHIFFHQSDFHGTIPDPIISESNQHSRVVIGSCHEVSNQSPFLSRRNEQFLLVGFLCHCFRIWARTGSDIRLWSDFGRLQKSLCGKHSEF